MVAINKELYYKVWHNLPYYPWNMDLMLHVHSANILKRRNENGQNLERS